MNESFSHAAVSKYVGVSWSCISRFLKCDEKQKTVENQPGLGVHQKPHCEMIVKYSVKEKAIEGKR